MPSVDRMVVASHPKSRGPCAGDRIPEHSECSGEIAAIPVKPALWGCTGLDFYLCFCFPVNHFGVSVSQVWKQQVCNFGRTFLSEFLIVLLFRVWRWVTMKRLVPLVKTGAVLFVALPALPILGKRVKRKIGD